MDVVSENRHASLHHLIVFIVADAGHDPLLLLGNGQGVKGGPHLFGDSHHIVDDDLIEEPHLSAQLRHFEQIGVEGHQGVLDIVDSFLNEDELKDRQDVDLNVGDGLRGYRRLDDSGDSLEAASCCQLSLAIVVVVVSLLSIFVEQLEEQLRQVLDELQGEGPNFSSKVLNDALE